MNTILSFSSVMSTIFYVAIAILIILLMVLIHELGHYTAGKILGFKINEFSVGFGKAIWQKTKANGEVISLRVFPLGGYCAFEGEDEESDNKDAFNNQKPWKRLIVLFAGVFFNFLSAVLFSFILLLSYGYEIPQITKVIDTTPNSNYNILHEGDVIYAVDGKKIDFVYDNSLQSLLKEYVNSEDFKSMEEKTVPLKVRRNGKYQIVNAKLIETVDGTNVSYNLNINLRAYRCNFWEALGQCWTFTFRWAYKVLIIFGQLITGKLSFDMIGGTVTTISVIANYTSQGFAYVMLLLPLIAVNLAVFNILPIPSLDGAHMVFVLIEMIRGKPINKNVEAWIHTIGLYCLLALVVILDVLHYVM